MANKNDEQSADGEDGRRSKLIKWAAAAGGATGTGLVLYWFARRLKPGARTKLETRINEPTLQHRRTPGRVFEYLRSRRKGP